MKQFLIIVATSLCMIVSSGVDAATGYKIKTVAFKPQGWLRYPYIGGPDEDSMFHSLPLSLDGVQNYKPENVVEVTVKSKGSALYEVPLWITVSQNDSGYVYQFGENLGQPKTILLWWIQKRPFTVPDADSVFVSLKD